MNQRNWPFFVILFLFAIQLTAQPAIEWERSYGGSWSECVYGIVPTHDGGYVLAGNSNSTDGQVTGNHGYDDIWVFKIDSIGELIWQRSIGGSLGEFANSIRATPDSGFVLVATASSDNFEVRDNHGKSDMLVVKLTKDGEIAWKRALGGDRSESGNAIQLTADGGYIVAGGTYSEYGQVSGNHGGYDFWLVKLTAEGEIEWQKCFGGSGDEIAFSILQTQDNGYIVAGTTTSKDGDVSENNGKKDYWIVKLNEELEIEWERSFGGQRNDYPEEVVQAADGGFVVAGYAQSHSGDIVDHRYGVNYWVVKLSAEGDSLWTKCLGGSGDDEAYSMQPTADGAYIIAGYTGAPSSYIGKTNFDVSGFNGYLDYWIVKLSDEGEIIWQECYGGSSSDMAFYAIQTADGGYLLGGTSDSTDGDATNTNGRYDVWVVKLAPEVTSEE